MQKYEVLRAFGLEGGGTARLGTVVELSAAQAKKLAKMKPPAIGLHFEDDEPEEVEPPKSRAETAARKRRQRAPVSDGE